jgi:hypothetical protein
MPGLGHALWFASRFRRRFCPSFSPQPEVYRDKIDHRLVDSSNPAIPFSTIVQIYCTGLGAVTNQPASVSPPLGLSYTTITPTVSIGGVPAQVLFSGLPPGSVGEYQVDALVPAGSSKGAAVSVVITIGVTASNTLSPRCDIRASTGREACRTGAIAKHRQAGRPVAHAATFLLLAASPRHATAHRRKTPRPPDRQHAPKDRESSTSS